MDAWFVYVPLLVCVSLWIAVWRWPLIPLLQRSGVVALAIVTACAGYGSWIVAYYTLHPIPSTVAPWKDAQILDLSLLGLFAPIGLITGLVAAVRGSHQGLILPIVLVALPLSLLGCMAGAAV